MSTDDAIEYVTKMSPRADDVVVFKLQEGVSPEQSRAICASIRASGLYERFPRAIFLLAIGTFDVTLMDDDTARRVYTHLQRRFKTEML